MQRLPITNISASSPIFPEKLNQLDQIPKNLYMAGNMELLKGKKPILGIVGSRKVTPYGRSITAAFAEAAAREGAIIASGLALGVDSIAHKAALDSRGATMAVLPGGIEKIYPAGHHGLARQIIDHNGLLVSEYEGDFMPHRHSFIERNRIIAALSDVLLITEAAQRSGSLHTARFALELGRTVATVPGNITSPYSAGTNNLIRSGAVPVLESDDLLELLDIKKKSEAASETSYSAENETEAAILAHLKESELSGHELLQKSGLETPIFQTHLTMLEIKGVIEPLGNNMWKLR